MSGKRFYVYILTSQKNGTLYVGVTNNIIRRVQEHKGGLVPGFTKRYKVDKLVYYEVYGEIGQALYREKQIKKWNREWKINLIKKENLEWLDLFNNLL